MKAKLLFCHGARAASWREPFDSLAVATRQQTKDPIALAFLEFMEPNFSQAVEQLVNAGATQINVMLLFLAAGGHTLNDVSALVKQAKLDYPSVEFHVSNTLLASTIMHDATLKWINQPDALS